MARARLAGSADLKMPEPTKNAVAAQLHHQRRIGGCCDTACGKIDHRETSQLLDFQRQFVGQTVIFSKSGHFFTGICAS